MKVKCNLCSILRYRVLTVKENEKMYCAIIGDIVSSRKYKDRQKLQHKFQQAMDQINHHYNDHIASNFTITLGDEFQGLLFTPSISYNIIQEIREALSPVQLVFGVGVGDIETNFSKEISIGSDGPVYHRARDMVMKAKLKGPSLQYSLGSEEDSLINGLLYFIESCTKKRTKRQKEVIYHYNKNKNQYETAKQLNIDQSTVSRILRDALYYEVLNAEEVIIGFLHEKYESNT